MEIFIVLIVVFILYSFIKEYLSSKNPKIKNGDYSKTDLNKKKHEILKSLDLYVPENDKQTTKPIEAKIVNEEKNSASTVINNIYIQNIYPERNKNKINKKSESKDHSEKIWKELGYKIKSGETYSYKMYGNKIFTPEQVEKIGSYNVKYSESGLTKKLLDDTGSKNLTKKILTESYGLDESKANILIKSNVKNITYKSKKYDYENYRDSSMSEWVQQANMSKGWD